MAHTADANVPNDPNSVIKAAREAFLASGYARTTIKSIAAAAGVAPTVVSNLYNNKDALFAAAMALPFDPQRAIPALIAPGIEGMGERIVRSTFQLVSDENVRNDLGKAAGMVQGTTISGIDVFGVVKPLSDYFQTAIIDKALIAVGIPDARLRGALISAYLSGVIAYRYIMKVEPLASLPEDQAVALVAPMVQQLLDPTKPIQQS
jgi:AcrR family transcriptional regulator